MNDRLNKTSICTVIFLDIVGYSQCTDTEQITQKTQFNALISEAIKNVAQNDRILLDTGDGAAIALLGAPEEALFIAMTIRDGIHALNEAAAHQLLVRIGINLGPVRVVKDINSRPNIIGDGINVAQRVMSFAEPNQILVSRSYYEVTARLSKEITELFTYSGIKQDKHVREHEVYAIGAYHQASMIAANLTQDKPASGLRIKDLLAKSKTWWPVTALLLIVIVLTAMLASGQLDIGKPEQAEAALPTTTDNSEIDVDTQEVSTQPAPEQQANDVEQKTQIGQKEQNTQKEKTSSSTTKQSNQSFSWDSIKENLKKGSDKTAFCSDAARALNQCD